MRTAALVVSLAVLICAGPAAARTCDRACLRGFVSDYLAALMKHDPAALPVAANVRFTEDSQDLKLGQGLWADTSGLGAFRQDILDPATGTAGAFVVAEEAGQPVLLVLRLKVADRKITEVETQVTHNRAEGGLFEPGALTAPLPGMDDRPSPSERLPAKKRSTSRSPFRSV